MDATQKVARQAQAAMAAIVERIRGSPVVHADETGWREDGHNGYVWTFSTPTQRYCPGSSQGQALRRGRGKAVVDDVLGEEFAGVLVSDFYAAYHHYDGPKNAAGPICCGTSTTGAPATPRTRHWHSGPTPSIVSMSRPRLLPILQSSNDALPNWPWSNGCWPYRDDPSAAQARLCRRMEKHIKELFVFVAEPGAPPDNNAAERSLRPVVISRGTRSVLGTDTRMTLASVFGTWRAQALNPLTACRQLLTTPQV